MESIMKKIDVHHHITPKFYLQELESIGITESFNQAFPKWTPEKSFSYMKKFEIDTAIVSISTPGVSLYNDTFSRKLARACNEYMAELKTKYPNKFGGFAAIPLSYPRVAMEELIYALDVLKLDGVGLFTHYDGTYLGDPKYDEVFKELNNRKTVVYVHPTDPIGQYDPKLEIANSIIEAPFETTRAVANLIHKGTADRYPEIKYILSHGGGTIPFLAWKIALIKYAEKDIKPSIFKMIDDIMIKGSPEAGLQILRNMYYDTALTVSTPALKALQEFADPAHIVFGSDLPFSEKVLPMGMKSFNKFDGFSQAELDAISFKNCLELFPSLHKN
jgi:predicted TIM-barrel fold metal-dependent hydrolase